MESSGLGDLKLGGLYDLAQWEHGRRMHLTLSLSLPVGSIDEKHTDGTTLGYGMQLGSEPDFHPALPTWDKAKIILMVHKWERLSESMRTIRITLWEISLSQPCGVHAKLLIH